MELLSKGTEMKSFENLGQVVIDLLQSVVCYECDRQSVSKRHFFNLHFFCVSYQMTY